jgi:hypothetical protein
MTAAERRAYLAESLFLNSVTYENEMLSAYVRRLGATPGAAPAARKAASARKPAPSGVKKKTAKKSRSR